ncbi:MAG: amino acid adenylation domain-containing protein, partial [Acidobacteriota bacterium]
WTGHLGGMRPVALPADRPHRAFGDAPPAPARARLDLPAALRTLLEDLGRAHGATFYMVLLAAFQAVLARFDGSGSRAVDVPVATPVAGREAPEIAHVLGFFVNTLVLRGRVTTVAPFADLLAQTRDDVLEAFAHQHVPFARIVEAVNPARRLGRMPLTDVLFALQSQVDLAAGAAGAAATDALFGDDVAASEAADAETLAALAVELSLIAIPRTDGGLRLALRYDADRYDRTTALRLLAAYRRALEAVAADRGTTPVAQLPLLSPAAQHQVQADWNDVVAVAPGDADATTVVATTVVARLAARLAEDPERVAVRRGDRALRRVDLDRASNRLARALRLRGASVGRCVAVCVPRDLELAVALVAVRKSGAYYLPIDASLPASRIAFLLEDADATIVLTTRAIAESTPALAASDATVLALDDPEAGLAQLSDAALEDGLIADPSDPAYLIYTSGSTGRPKGVLVRDASLVGLLDAIRMRMQFPTDGRLLAMASVSFDLAQRELFLPLVTGGELILADAEALADGAQLMAQVRAAAPHMINTTPATWRLLLDAGWSGPLPVASSGAETLPASLADALLTRVDALYNVYGPTEATIASIVARVTPRALADASAGAHGGTLPIGRPLAGRRVVVVDPIGGPDALQPPGAVGELLIGGPGIAIGYVGRPALTAARFVPDPHPVVVGGDAPLAGQRLYRTGDRVRQRADGQIAFLGRFDDQIKLRGYRIELGEIEAALMAHPAVGQAAVVLDRGAPDVDGAHDPARARLVAYVDAAAVDDADDAETPASDALRDWLASQLPAYMVPAQIAVLDALPVTASRKIGRRALPALDALGLAVEAFVAPRTETERAVCAAFEAVLASPAPIGADDDFFARGGHSLLATRLLSRLRASFEVDLPLRALFETPTPSGLAARIDAETAHDRPAATPRWTIEPQPRADDGPTTFPLSASQLRLAFLEQLTPGSRAYHMPVSLALRGALDARAFRLALRHLIARHEALRTMFAQGAGDAEPAQRVLPADAPTAPTAGAATIDLRALAGDAARAHALRRIERWIKTRPFALADPDGARPIRLALVALADDDHRWLACIHHITFDGWSLGVLLRELGAAYRALAAPTPSLPSLPALPVQFADFALWQRARIANADDADLGWWRAHLAAVEPLDLPGDRPHAAEDAPQGGLAA